MLRISIINGPNLNLVGTREPHIYGTRTIAAFVDELHTRFPQATITYFQSNGEGELIDLLHSAIGATDAIIVNLGAYTHTSIALADAIAAINIPVAEVHISNIHAREPYRQHSYTAAKAIGCITGFGLEGYAMAVAYFISSFNNE